MGVTANDTALFAASNTAYTRSLTAPFSKVAGQRYAAGPLVVTAAATPTFVGGGNALIASEQGLSPRISGTVNSQTDFGALASTIAAASISDTGSRPQAVLLP